MAEILRDLYQRHGSAATPQKLIAQELGISQPTLSLWLKALGMRQRTVLEPKRCIEGGDAHQ